VSPSILAKSSLVLVCQPSAFGISGFHMGLAEEQEAWLEREGRTYALQGNCSIGRAPLNTVVLELRKSPGSMLSSIQSVAARSGLLISAVVTAPF
jgi:hypothetical protein